MKTNKKRWIWIALSIFHFQFSIVFLSGCIEDTLHNTPHPDRGAVRVNVAEARGGTGNSYFVRVGEVEESIGDGQASMATLFEPGEYTLLAHDAPAGMTVNGTTATVNVLPDGTLEPCPGELHYATTRVTVVADDTVNVTMPLPRRTRRLTLTFAITDGNPATIAAARASLTGILPAIEMLDGSPTGESATVSPVFGKSPVLSGANAIPRDGSTATLSAELNLLGVVEGARQIFKLVITATDGQQQTVTVDMTETLAAFNTGNSPLVLSSDLTLMESGEFNITDWVEGMAPGEGEAEAN